MIFHSTSNTAIDEVKPAAKVDEQGNFELITGGKTGAPAGTYKVTFFWAGKQGSKGLGGDAEGPGKNAVSEQYQFPDKAIIEVTITEDTRELEPFRLK